MLQRLKRCIFHCHRIREGEDGYQRGLDLFCKPISRMINIRGVSGELSLVTGGELNTKNLIAKVAGPCPYQEGDRCYIDVRPPKEHDVMCNSADYKVVSVLRVHNVSEVVFEKTVGRMECANV